MEQELEKRAEHALITVILSMATLIVCFGVLLFH
jgi:hypothetical protein